VVFLCWFEIIDGSRVACMLSNYVRLLERIRVCQKTSNVYTANI